MTTSKFEFAALDLLGQILEADDVGTGLGSGLGIVALGEHRDAHGLAGAVGQHGGTAHHLVGLARIDAEIDRTSIDSANLALASSLTQAQRLIDGIEPGRCRLFR